MLSKADDEGDGGSLALKGREVKWSKWVCRMKVLEAAAEQLQAALLASLDEESSSKQAAAPKSKRKGGKKGKRSKKDGATTPLAQPPIAESTAPEDEAKEEAEVESTKEELAQAEPSGRREEPHSEAESSSTAADDDRGAAAAAAAIAASSAEALGLHKDARASTSEDEEDWKVLICSPACAVPLLSYAISSHQAQIDCHVVSTECTLYSMLCALSLGVGLREMFLAGGGKVGAQAPWERCGCCSANDSAAADAVAAAADRHGDAPAAAARALQAMPLRHIPVRLHMLRRVRAVHGQRSPRATSSSSAAESPTSPAAAAAERRLFAGLPVCIGAACRGRRCQIGDPAKAGPAAHRSSARCKQWRAGGQQGRHSLHSCWSSRQACRRQAGSVAPGA